MSEIRRLIDLVESKRHAMNESLIKPTPAENAANEFDRTVRHQWGSLILYPLATYKEWEVSAREWPIEGDDLLFVRSFQTDQRGQGYGSRILDLLCEICDKHGVTIYLDADAYDRGLSQRDLVAFYRSRGFRFLAKMRQYATMPMVREPQ